MLDDTNVIKQRDTQDALGLVARSFEQLSVPVAVQAHGDDDFTPENVVVTAMGGASIAAATVKQWVSLPVPFEITRGYEVPAYVNEKTLVIAMSYSGGTEETLSAAENARLRGARLAVVTSGGRLQEMAHEHAWARIDLPHGIEPRYGVTHNMRALARILETYGLVERACDEMAANSDWLESEIQQWLPTVPTEHNYAKQLAEKAVGKTPVVYAGSLMAPVAYRWKTGFNENAKNVAFWNELPEMNHNEFIGWTSHPVEKPFAVFDVVSNFEHEQVQKRFDATDRLLSGKRPKATRVELQGENPIAQMVWGGVLGDFVSIYMGILNGVDPTPVELVGKLKKELTQ